MFTKWLSLRSKVVDLKLKLLETGFKFRGKF